MNFYRENHYTDEMLIDLLQTTDDNLAFTELYERYWDKMFDLAYQRLNSVSAAQEVVQDVFIKLYIRRKNLRITSTIEAYLRTAVKYKVFNVYRAEQVRQLHADEMLGLEHTYPETPLLTLEKKELRSQLYDFTARMPEKRRKIFLMRHFEDLSTKDIAERLDISISTVKKHITKAMEMIRTDFKHHKYDLIFIILLFSGK